MLRFKTITAMAALLWAIFIALDLYYGLVPWWAYALVFLGWFVLTVIGSFHIRWNYHLESLHSKKDIAQNWAALTFDDGPHPEFTPKILALLDTYGAKATFFCIGKNAEAHPELVMDIKAAGHTIGNHTYSHSPNFGFFGTQRVIGELQRTQRALYDILGQKTLLYRPAFGVTNPNIKKAVAATGLRSIGWSIRSLDTTGRSDTAVLKRITDHLAQGDVVLMHDTSLKSVVVLEQLLLFLRNKNIASVTVDRLFNIEPYA